MIQKIEYLKTDSLPEIVDKNTRNIDLLFGEFQSGGLSFAELVAKVNQNTSDIAAVVADLELTKADVVLINKNIVTLTADINTAQTTADGAQTAADGNGVRLTTVELVAATNKNDIAKLMTNGIGGYVGTYRGRNADDKTMLPASALDQERAILEFLDVDDVKYQEYKWDNAQWNKIGGVLDSHIHSQSGGISLQDVANQQDPKIAIVDGKAVAAQTTADKNTVNKLDKTETEKVVIDLSSYVFSSSDIGKKVFITYDDTYGDRVVIGDLLYDTIEKLYFASSSLTEVSRVGASNISFVWSNKIVNSKTSFLCKRGTGSWENNQDSLKKFEMSKF